MSVRWNASSAAISASRSPASAAACHRAAGLPQRVDVRVPRSRMRRTAITSNVWRSDACLLDLAHGQRLDPLALVGDGLDEPVVLQDRRWPRGSARGSRSSARPARSPPAPRRGAASPSRWRGAAGRRSARGAASARSARGLGAGRARFHSWTRGNLLRETSPAARSPARLGRWDLPAQWRMRLGQSWPRPRERLGARHGQRRDRRETSSSAAPRHIRTAKWPGRPEHRHARRARRPAR